MDRLDLIAGNLGFAAAAALSLWLLTVEEAPAAPVCGDRATIVSTLEGRYAESRRVMGLMGSGRVMELFAAANGSWTAIVTDTAGRTCILGVGEAWTEFAPEPEGPEA